MNPDSIEMELDPGKSEIYVTSSLKFRIIIFLHSRIPALTAEVDVLKIK